MVRYVRPADAEAVVLVGRIVTMDQPAVAEAILIEDGTVVAVGTREDVLAFAGDQAQVLELGSNVAYPGFIDVHAHWIGDRAGATGYGSAMPRDPNIPDAFDVYTVVLLRRPDDAPEMPEHELAALQSRHLAYRAKLRDEGVLVANGPLGEQSDLSLRGLSMMSCDLDEARRLSDLDPSVQAGRLTYDVFEWWVAAGTLAFPGSAHAVGERRAMPDD